MHGRTGTVRIGRRLASRAGVTLIELLTVTLIIGIIAVIALPRLDGARRQARFATVISDLRNLGAAQERHYQSNFEYAADLDLLDFEPAPDVEIDVIEATSRGWAAVASHEGLADAQGCAIYLGNATPPALPSGELMSSEPGVTECSR